MNVNSFLKNSDTRIAIIFLFVSVVFIFFRLGAPHLADWDEALYAGIAGDMVRQGDLITLTLQGTPWFEKEPLPFWLMAAALRLFGFYEYAVRLPAAFFSIFLAPLMYLCARYWFNKPLAALAALFFFFSPPLWDAHALRTGNFDTMALSLFLFSFVLYVRVRMYRFWWVVGIPLALGFLTRGVMGLLPLLLIVTAEFLRRVWMKEEKNWSFQRMVFFISGVCFPWFLWHLFLWTRFGSDYVAVYWKEQFFGRIAGPLQGHVGSADFYLTYWLDNIGVFFLILAFSAIFLVYRFVSTHDYKQAILIIWLLLTMAPIHIMETKLSWYALPVLPALWLSAAFFTQQVYLQFIVRVSEQKRTLYRIIVIILALCLFLILLFWMRGLTRGLSLLETHAFRHPLSTVAAAFPTDAPVVIYRVGGWNYGRLLPSWYWYIRFVYDWQPFLINTQNIEYYAARPAAFPFWLTDEQGFEALQNTLGSEYAEIIQTSDYLYLVKNKMP
ncbi:MAG TPA: hypothetical protein DDW36_04150 [Candidatus Magasanikbacteria bacterium]|nr:hypothetical protein [Candidatus Magasanikbacteria bacterium]